MGKRPAVSAAATRKSPAPLPVTLLSGFLGSGKTSLLSSVLTNVQGLRCAVIVNEITNENLDARIVSAARLLKAEEKLVEMPNGCICCTLREDLLLQLRELAAARSFDAVLIESSGIAEPMQVAETFFVSPDDRPMLQDGVAPLDNCVTVVDATSVADYLHSTGTAADFGDGCDDGGDDRNLAQLFVDQIEFANVVLLNKTDLVPAARTVELVALLQKLNPRAKVVPSVRGAVPLDVILRTGHFTEEFAASHLEWMEDIRSGIKHVPETLEYGISSAMFHAERPFHPGRLHAWIHRYFALCEPDAAPCDDDNAAPHDPEAAAQELLEASKARSARYGLLFRGKGFVWIGSPSRQPMFGNWSQAGHMLNLSVGGVWTAFPARDGGEQEVAPHQRLAFVGQNLKADVLKADLSECLCTAVEAAALEDHCANIGPQGDGPLGADPFEPWAEVEEGEEEEGEEEEGEEEEGEEEEGEEGEE